MKIGIVGSAERAVAWEEILRHHVSVTEVVIARALTGIGNVDACILTDEGDTGLATLLEAVKKGYHTFLVSRLPQDRAAVEQIYHASEESNVLVQFSHWPTLSPASQWMFQKVPKPNFIQIVREISYTDFLERDTGLKHYWIDELAFCTKWINGAIHNIDVNRTGHTSEIGGAIHFHIRYDSGATAAIYITTAASRNNHRRTAANNTYLLECDVLEQSVRAGQVSDNGHLFFNREVFEASESAELACSQFLKAIQLRKATPYGAYDLMRTLKAIDRITKKLPV